MTIQSRIGEPQPHGTVATARTNPDELRHDWTREELQALFDLPFNDLLFEAQLVHRRWFKADEVQMSTLLSIKTGGCPEDCG
jgi:biotin synthase